MLSRISRATLGLMAVASVMITAGPPVSASEQTRPCDAICFYSGVFSGQTARYADAGSDCVTLPAVAHSVLNLSPRNLALYTSEDCSDISYITIPRNDFHNFSADIRSFRVAS